MGAFSRFLMACKLSKYTSRLFDKLNQKQFAILLLELKNDLTIENFYIFESLWLQKMTKTCESFLIETHKIFEELESQRSI